MRNGSEEKIWRVAYRPPSPFVPDCVFAESPCRDSGDDLSGIALFILGILLPHGAKVVFGHHPSSALNSQIPDPIRARYALETPELLGSER